MSGEKQPQHPSDAVLGAFVDGRVEADTRRTVLAHLEMCNDCMAAVLAANAHRGEAAAGRERAPSRIWLAAAAILIALVAVPLLLWRRSDPMERLVDLAPRSARVVEPRLTGGFDWAEYAGAPRAADGANGTGEMKLAGAAGELVERADRRSDAESQHAAGVALVLVQRPADGIARLEAAASRSNDAHTFSDLAAARYAAASQLGRASLYPSALAAAEAALRLDPNLAEALFNRALIVERLGLAAEARRAWERYLEIDSSSPWAAEARAHLAELQQSTRASHFDRDRPLLERAAETGDEAAVRAYVATHLGRARAFAESEYLGSWGDAVQGGRDAEAARWLAIARRIGDALAAVNGETQIRDAVHAIDVARDRRPIAAAHVLYRTARIAYSRGERDAVPATLKGSLMARLDRLGTAQDIAQIASVIGREFYSALLLQAAAVDEETLARDLDRLLESEIIIRRGLPSEGLYLFKHVLIQQAAYDSILASDARELHRRIAEGMEATFPALVEGQPEIVAFHFEHAGVPDKAIDYRERAAERSLKNSANPEAIAHLKKCLDLLEALPAGADRDRREMRLRTNLALPLIATKGYAADEVDETLRRAKELCAEVGDNEELFRTIRLHWTFQMVRGDHRNALEAARQIVAMAESEGAPHQQLEARRVLGSSLFLMGCMEEAREQFARALALSDRERDRGHMLIYGMDPAVGCLSGIAPALWHLGRIDEARASAAQATALARESGHPYTICYSLFFASLVHALDRNRELVQSTAAEMMEVSKDQSFAFWEAVAAALEAWAKEQAATMREALTKIVGMGARVYSPTFFSLLADLHAAQGNHDAASKAVEEGLAISAATGEMLGVPRLEQQRAELLELVKQ